jgi:hypothetical protein
MVVRYQNDAVIGRVNDAARQSRVDHDAAVIGYEPKCATTVLADRPNERFYRRAKVCG